MNELFSLQPLLLGALLAWSGLAKAAGRLSAARAGRTALPRLVGASRAADAYRATGGVELLIGAALLLPSLWWWEPVATCALAVCFLGFLTYARVAAPDSSCGCLGSSSAPVSARSLARAGLLLGAGGAMLAAQDGWVSAVADQTALSVSLALVEIAVFVALSAELDRWWLLPLRGLHVRLTHPLAQRTAYVPLASTVQQLLRSPAYLSVGSSVRSDVQEHWDDGEWRFVTYAIARDDRQATGVFAVPLNRHDPDSVRVAVVDEATGETLYRPDPEPAV